MDKDVSEVKRERVGSQILKSERRYQVRKGLFQAIFVENPTQGMMEGWVRVRILLIASFFFFKVQHSCPKQIDP